MVGCEMVAVSGDQDDDGSCPDRVDGALTVDLEDWKCALDPAPDADYSKRPEVDEDYLKRTAKSLLEALDAADSRATFFVLGEVAAAVPEVVKDIARRGHEIASHSPVHLPPRMVPRDEFKRLMIEDISLLEELSGKNPLGFRAPYFSVSRKGESWLMKTLVEVGLKYDSSVVPTRTPYWGIPFAPKSPYFPRHDDLSKSSSSGPLLEVPVTVWPHLGHIPGLPVGGGFYMRAWPSFFLLSVLRRTISSGYPLVLYIHPGNLDSEKDFIAKRTLRDRISQNVVAKKGAPIFRTILKEFRFGTIAEVFSNELSTVRQVK